MEQLSAFKILGTFSIIIMILIWLGPAMVNLGKFVMTGDYKEALKSTGGRIFVIDQSLKEETNYLLQENGQQTYAKVFHLAYAFVLLFMLFFTGYFIYRAGSWILGTANQNALTDVILALVVITLYCMLEFFYSSMVLSSKIIPFKDGILYFALNLPKIISILFL